MLPVFVGRLLPFALFSQCFYCVLAFVGISNEIVSVFPDCKREILGQQHILFYVGDHVKLSFFAPKNRVPVLHSGFTYNNLKTVDAQDALGMKLFTITVRNLYRDYYDIYSLLQAGLSFDEGLDYALKFTRHQVHSKAILSVLITPTLYPEPKDLFTEVKGTYSIFDPFFALWIQQSAA